MSSSSRSRSRSKNLLDRSGVVRFVISVLIMGLVLFTANAHAINVLVVGGPGTGNQATNEIFDNGDLIGTISRPTGAEYQALTTEDIVNNYDVMVLTYNASAPDWNTRMLPFLASGGGVVWGGFIWTGTGGSPLITQQFGPRYVCPNGSICYIPNSTLNPDVPLDVLPVAGLTDGLGNDFTKVGGYFASWDASMSPALQVNADGLGTITYAVNGVVNAGRAVLTQIYLDNDALSTGDAAEQNTYDFLKNAIIWAGSSTLPPDPNLRFVPNLKGLAEADAYAALADLGFVDSPWTFYQASNWYVPGTVWGQNPQPGAGGFVGDEVSMTINPLPTGAPVTVPDLSGMTYTEADDALAAVSLDRSCCISGHSSSVPAGQVITQYPRPGVESTEGWTVDVLMSDGPPVVQFDGRVSVPGLRLMTQSEAEAEIVATGFTVGQVILQNHATITAGTVIDQSIYSSLPLGDAIDITVSAGPAGTVLVTVPDTVGQTQAAAEAAVTDVGLNVSVSTAFSDVVAAGIVISQSPAGGSEAAENSSVNLVVSAGPAPVVITVPDVAGTAQADAESAILSAGLAVGAISTASSATVPAGVVISQNPAAGTEVDPGSTVDLVVSSGPALVDTPNVVGLSQAAAESAIAGAGLVVGSVSTSSSNTVAAGDVISQNPGAGTQVSEGSSVDLVVSSGPDLVTVPNVVGLSYSTATNAINAAGLSVGSVSTVLTRRSCGVVRSQTPAGGTDVAAGSSIDLVVTRTRFCNPL